uniref:RanBD1 domain-containing protein n=1 Tax=Caenorhabditis tropicalis TaxID=1561998 RepID=A0A1I7UM81_9PELO
MSSTYNLQQLSHYAFLESCIESRQKERAAKELKEKNARLEMLLSADAISLITKKQHLSIDNEIIASVSMEKDNSSNPKDLKRRHQDVLQSSIPTKTFRFNASAQPFVSSYASSRPSFNFNVFATPFVSSGSSPTGLRPTAPVFTPRSSSYRQSFNFNVFATPFVSSGSQRIGLRPTAPVFTPRSLSSPEGSYPSTPSSSECPSPTSSGSSTPKTTVSANPISGGFVFNMGVANAPEQGFYTEKFHLDEDAFLISVIEKTEDRSPKKMREFSPEELQKQDEIVNEMRKKFKNVL